jgi:hypothetical protein
MGAEQGMHARQKRLRRRKKKTGRTGPLTNVCVSWQNSPPLLQIETHQALCMRKASSLPAMMYSMMKQPGEKASTRMLKFRKQAEKPL